MLHDISYNKFKQDPDIIVSFTGWGGGVHIGKNGAQDQGHSFPQYKSAKAGK